MDLDNCMIYCQEDKTCKFVSFFTRSSGMKGCRKYKSCETSREGVNLATTYSRDVECPGELICLVLIKSFANNTVNIFTS